MRRALIINPEFRIDSFWNYRDTCELLGARYPSPPLGLCTVAALLPQDWEIRLIDRNVEAWDPKLLDWSNVVLTGGMFPQRAACLEIVREARKRGKTVIIGGPDASAIPQHYRESTHLVLGEAEATLPMFLDDFRAGRAARIYQSDRFCDISRTPVPRFDLLKFRHYEYMAVQFSRGCPFLCEFCDVPEVYGRVPRTKSPMQMLAELQTLHELGYRGHIHIVDDNFIGNKRAASRMLFPLQTWLGERHWPFEFSASVSINLTSDETLLRAMRQAGFFAVFVGIESTQPATLSVMRKKQNLGVRVAECVRTLYRHGIWVNTGFILGADGETAGAADSILECIEATAIPVNMVGLMFAMPKAPLTRRLRKEGRLPAEYDEKVDYDGDHCAAGLNFEPRRPRTEVLRDYLRVIETIYTPAAYFSRVCRVASMLDCAGRRFRPGPVQRLAELKAFIRMAHRFGRNRDTRRDFWRAVIWTFRHNRRAIRPVGALCALYVHLGPHARYLASRIRSSLDAAHRNSERPPPVDAPEVRSTDAGKAVVGAPAAVIPAEHTVTQ
jgi:hypothetical protein